MNQAKHEFSHSGKLKIVSIVQLVLFVLSTMVCVIASIFNDLEKVPFIGIIDVGLGVIIFLLYVYFYFLFPTDSIPDFIYRKAYTFLINLFSISLILMGLYFLDVDIQWYVLVIGLSWRYWLFALSLPYNIFINFPSPI